MNGLLVNKKLVSRLAKMLMAMAFVLCLLPLSQAQEQSNIDFLPSIVTQLLGEETVEVPSDQTRYNITLEFLNPPSPQLQQAFEAAADVWENVITGDLSDVIVSNLTGCSGQQILANNIDDIHIQIDAESIDGRFGFLITAEPSSFRSDNNLPSAGCMTLDTDNVPDLIASGNLENLLIHEMAHVLGFGTLWPSFGLIINELPGGQPNPSLPQPQYVGINAVAQWEDIGGLGSTIPLENGFTNGVTNGAELGAVNIHWSKTDFDNEIMTFSLGNSNLPLSVVTIGSFEDLGYTVDYTAADAFFVD